MVASEVVTLMFYIISIAFLPEYFGEFFHVNSGRVRAHPNGTRPCFCYLH